MSGLKEIALLTLVDLSRTFISGRSDEEISVEDRRQVFNGIMVCEQRGASQDEITEALAIGLSMPQ